MGSSCTVKTSGHVLTNTGEPLKGVLVSNGRTVGRTDPDGAFSFDTDGGGFVFVTRPSGFATAEWFCRTSGETISHDFILERVEQPVPFTFAQVTDLHLCVDAQPTGSEVRRPLTSQADLAALLAEIEKTRTPDGSGVAFVAATGDLTDWGVPAEYAAVREVFGATRLPIEILPGNHDHYGHSHDPRPGDDPRESYGMSTGTTTRYEEHLGPRWWSMDYGGVHFAAVDWFSHRLGGDREMQEAWLHADLAAQPDGTPVVLLVHDPMKRDFFERLRRAVPRVRLLGTFSGHWHTCRTILDGGEVHANTGNATFGSCDFTPPHYRLCTWDGTALEIKTVTRSSASGPKNANGHPPARPAKLLPEEVWSVNLPGDARMAAPVVTGVPDGPVEREMVFAAWGNEDVPGGGMSALDAASGTEVWCVRAASSVRTGAAYTPGENGSSGTVVFSSVSGETFAVDAGSGEKLWRVQVGDPLHMWVYQEPLVHDGLVFVGDVASFRALDLSTGETLWERGDLGKPENYVSVAHPVVQAKALLVGFMEQSPSTWGLDPRTGKTLWTAGQESLPSPMSGFFPDPDGEHVYTVRFGGTLEKLSASTGERRWKARVETAFTAGRPALTPDGTGLVAASSAGTIYRFNAETGKGAWHAKLPDEALLPMGPYRKSGPVVASGPTVTARTILQGTCGGKIYSIDPDSGESRVVASLDTSIAAPLAQVGEDAIAVGVDGVVRRLNVSGQTF